MTKPKPKHIFCTFMLYCTLFIDYANAAEPTEIKQLTQKAEQGDAIAQYNLA